MNIPHAVVVPKPNTTTDTGTLTTEEVRAVSSPPALRRFRRGCQGGRPPAATAQILECPSTVILEERPKLVLEAIAAPKVGCREDCLAVR